MSRNQWVTLASSLALLVVALAYFAGAFHDKVDDQPVSAEIAPAAGKTHVVALVAEPRFESVPGTISATDETLIGARIMANVLKVTVRAGARVEPGQLLIELDGEALAAAKAQREQDAAAARAALQNARTARDRAVSLIASGSISQAAHDDAITAYRVASANLERAERAVQEAETALGYTRIFAPMAGTIVERFIEPGDTATPGRTLLRLYNPGRLRIEATLRESLVRRVGTGDVLTARIDAIDTTLDARVEEIVPAADPGSRTFTLKALMPPMEGVFPGMFARLDIPLGTVESIRIPTRAVHRSGQLEFVYVRTDAGDARRFVRLGESDGDTVVVRSGLRAGEVVITDSPQ